MSEDLQQQIDALKAEVAELRAQLWAGGPRFGPREETQAEINARTDRMVKTLEAASVTRTPDVAPSSASLPVALCTTNGKPVAEVRASQTNETGQHDGYIVLCPDERAKGFVRPYRDAYKHVGRVVDDDFDGDGKMRRQGGCGMVTTMGRSLSETYARDPKFYSATFCCGCNRHLPVAEFVWTADGYTVGS